LANQLAAHMRFDDDADRAALRAFWEAPSLAPKPGLKAVDMFDAVASGQIKAIWVVATNPAASMPRADRVRSALDACPFVAVSDCWPTDTTRFADVVLPAAAWARKTAPSPTPNASFRGNARSGRHRARPARIGGNSPRSAAAWVGGRVRLALRRRRVPRARRFVRPRQ